MFRKMRSSYCPDFYIKHNHNIMSCCLNAYCKSSLSTYLGTCFVLCFKVHSSNKAFFIDFSLIIINEHFTLTRGQYYSDMNHQGAHKACRRIRRQIIRRNVRWWAWYMRGGAAATVGAFVSAHLLRLIAPPQRDGWSAPAELTPSPSLPQPRPITTPHKSQGLFPEIPLSSDSPRESLHLTLTTYRLQQSTHCVPVSEIPQFCSSCYLEPHPTSDVGGAQKAN